MTAGKRDNRELLYKVLATLYRYSEDLVVLDYPRSIERRSIDLAVRLRGKTRLLVKVAFDADQIPRSEIAELAGLSRVLGVPGIIVSAMKGGMPLLEGVVYEKSGIRVVGLETLEGVLSGREEVYIYESKDTFKLSIDADKVRSKRLEKNLSLGDLALMVGVSRRAIYEYEKGSMEPTIEKGEKLVRVLGEDIVKPINIFEPARKVRVGLQENYDSELERKVALELEKAGYKVVHAKRTVLDISASTMDDKSGIKRTAYVVEHPRERPEKLVEKAYYLDKMSETIGVEERYVIVEDEKKARIAAREGLNPITIDEVLAQLRCKQRGDKEERRIP